MKKIISLALMAAISLLCGFGGYSGNAPSDGGPVDGDYGELIDAKAHDGLTCAKPLSGGNDGLTGTRPIGGDYEELTDTKPHDGTEVWQRMKKPVEAAWGSIDVRYPKHDVPQGVSKIKLTAWKGDAANAQAILWTREDLSCVRLEASDLKSGKNVIRSSAISTHFVRYVMTDELNKDRKGACGARPDKSVWDSSIVADALDIAKEMSVPAESVRPMWVKINVPRNAAAGRYKGAVKVYADSYSFTLPYELEVIDMVLPEPKDWDFDLDLWQNPYAVARYCDVPLWSEEHFEAMRPIMKMLADIGQKSITASIMHKPWAGQTYDHFDSMITRTLRIDGTWAYDYSVFDKWVSFMTDEIGIDGLIGCYTMIPWSLRFDYFDQATARVKFVDSKPGEGAYRSYWLPFLRDFARHLKEKGWFERAAISMDERPLDLMREAIAVIRAADPDFKITLAGDYHEEILDELHYLSIPYGRKFPADVLSKRRAEGKVSTVYTCCSEPFPNTFTFSAPVEATATPLHALAEDYDGYLRWAVMSWPEKPLQDSRFWSWAAGDTYSIYPGPRSSIRFERFAEGMRACAKVQALRSKLGEEAASGSPAAAKAAERLASLENALSRFKAASLTPETAVSALDALYSELNVKK